MTLIILTSLIDDYKQILIEFLSMVKWMAITILQINENWSLIVRVSASIGYQLKFMSIFIQRALSIIIPQVQNCMSYLNSILTVFQFILVFLQEVTDSIFCWYFMRLYFWNIVKEHKVYLFCDQVFQILCINNHFLNCKVWILNSFVLIYNYV